MIVVILVANSSMNLAAMIVLHLNLNWVEVSLAVQAILHSFSMLEKTDEMILFPFLRPQVLQLVLAMQQELLLELEFSFHFYLMLVMQVEKMVSLMMV